MFQPFNMNENMFQLANEHDILITYSCFFEYTFLNTGPKGFNLCKRAHHYVQLVCIVLHRLHRDYTERHLALCCSATLCARPVAFHPGSHISDSSPTCEPGKQDKTKIHWLVLSCDWCVLQAKNKLNVCVSWPWPYLFFRLND